MAYINFKPQDYFNTKHYSGDGSATQAQTGVGFQPDMVWIKSRSNAESHVLGTSVQGGNAYLIPDTSAAQATLTTYLKSFDADGFTVGLAGFTGTSSQTYASMNWKAGTTSGIATNGSTTITPSAYSFDQARGISIVKYTGNGTSGAKIAHGLGATPDIVICKRLGSSGSWDTVSKHIGATYYLRLDTNAAKATGTWAFNDTLPDSVNFTVGDNAETNSSDGNIAYCFKSIKGFSKIGGFYTGNANNDGPFCFAGFRPAFVMVKRIDSTGAWYMFDNKRAGYNGVSGYLQADSASAEDIASANNFGFDFLANGFKIKGVYSTINASGGTWMWMAFAENPIVGSNGTPGVAR